MAKIIRRTWRSPGPLGRKVKHVAYGYQLMVNGTRERKVSSDWLTEQDAMTALGERLKAMEAGQLGKPAQRTLGELAKEYLQYKRDQGKRTVDGDKRILEGRLLPALGTAVNVRTLTAQVLAQYEKRRAGEVSAYTVANELSLIRHMLRLAKRWGYVASAPEITLPKKPEGRRRYLAEEELGRLLAACRISRNPHLAAIVTLAVHTGMRKGELLGLEWERIDLSSARITLYDTKNGTPRGVPMNRAVYDVLVALEPVAAERTGLLFRRRRGGAWGQIRRAFETAVTKAKLARLPVPRPAAHGRQRTWSCAGPRSRTCRRSSGTRTSR